MKYLENYIYEFTHYYYKIGHNDQNMLLCFDKLPFPINAIINKKK